MPSHSVIDSMPAMVADASAVISLVASGAARELLGGLPSVLRVPKVVVQELETGRSKWTTSDSLALLIADGCIEVVELDEAGSDHFESLVVGSAVDTLDDGEAATIAYALTSGSVAIIDERKACRICEERFPHLVVQSAVSLLTGTVAERVLGGTGVGDALFNALTSGRMRVRLQDVERVIAIIGPERVAQCTSLPSRARLDAQRLAG